MADKIVVMHDGLVEQIGAPLELYDRPANLFVAGFIGSPAMNFLNGTIRRNGSAAFEGAGRRRACRSPPRPAAADGRPAVYGIRPEHFAIADDGAEAEVAGGRADRLGDPGGRASSAARRSSPCSASAINSSRATRSGSSPIRGSCICSTSRRGKRLQRHEHNGRKQP